MYRLYHLHASPTQMVPTHGGVDPRIGPSRESNKRQSQMECSFTGMSQVADNPFDMSVPIP